MSEMVLSESIYVKRTVSTLGGGGTSRESVTETLWFPYKVDGEYVEIYPIMDNMESVLMIKERVPAENFKESYEEKEGSRDLYLKLKDKVK